MNNFNLNNEKIKRRFFLWLGEAEGLSDDTIKCIRLALHYYEKFTNNEDFKSFNSDKAIRFKTNLRKKEYRGQLITESTYRTYLKYLKRFFSWLSIQPGYKSKIRSDSIEYFNLRKKENRVAYQYNHPEYPMPNYCIKLAKSIVLKNEIDNRDKAMISMSFLTGMRPHALVSLPLECIDESKMVVYQNPNLGVQTKFSKYITSKIFNFDDELLSHLFNWIRFLKQKGFSPFHPLFPAAKTHRTSDELTFQNPTEVDNIFLKTTSTIRKVFQERSKAACLKYYPPRTFRHTTVYYALKFVKTGEELKALSQHFGHEDISTTLSIYGNIDEDRLLEILNGMDVSKVTLDNDEEIRNALNIISKKLSKNFRNGN